MFPLLYETQHQAYQEDIPLWISLAARYKGLILELGCGSGRVALQLAKAGYQVTGLDNDPGMLKLLNSRLTPGMPVNVICADMAAFSLNQVYSMVILPCNTFNTLTTESKEATLQRVWKHLKPCGGFCVSVPNPSTLKTLPNNAEVEIEDIIPHPVDGNPVQILTEWSREENQIVFTWHYDHLFPDGKVERFSLVQRQYQTSLDDYLRQFHQAGFSIVTLSGDFNGIVYEDSSPYLVILAERS